MFYIQELSKAHLSMKLPWLPTVLALERRLEAQWM